MPGRKRPGGKGLSPALIGLRLRAAMALHERYRIRGGQKLLAADADVDAGNLSRMLRGKGGSEVTAATMVRLAAILEVTVGWLVNGEGGPAPVRAEAPDLPMASGSA